MAGVELLRFMLKDLRPMLGAARIEEKAKKGGYRCVTLKVFDYKGGDFVENQDYSMVVVDSLN